MPDAVTSAQGGPEPRHLPRCFGRGMKFENLDTRDASNTDAPKCTSYAGICEYLPDVSRVIPDRIQ